MGESPAQYDAVSDWFSEAVGVRCWLVRQRDGSRRAVDGKQLRQRGPPPTAEADGDSAQCLNESERNVSIGVNRLLAGTVACYNCQSLERGCHLGAGALCLTWGCVGWRAGFANEGQFLAISQSSLDDVNRRLAEKAGANTSPFQVQFKVPQESRYRREHNSERALLSVSRRKEKRCIVVFCNRLAGRPLFKLHTAVIGGCRAFPGKSAVQQRLGAVCRGCMATAAHRGKPLQCHRCARLCITRRLLNTLCFTLLSPLIHFHI